MKKKLGCLFYPVVIFVIMGVITIAVNAFTDDVADEQFNIADTEGYAIDYFMNTEDNLFLDLTNKTDDLMLVELTDISSGGQDLNSRGAHITNSISEPYEAELLDLRTPLESETSEQNLERMLLIDRVALALPMREDTRVSFGVEVSGSDLMKDMISHEVTGTLIVYSYDKVTGEIAEIGRHEFTKPAGVDGQL